MSTIDSLTIIDMAATDPAQKPASNPLPCEAIFPEAAKQQRLHRSDSAWFAKVAEQWGAPVKRIDPDSLRVSTPFTAPNGTQLVVPKFAVLDPFADPCDQAATAASIRQHAAGCLADAKSFVDARGGDVFAVAQNMAPEYDDFRAIGKRHKAMYVSKGIFAALLYGHRQSTLVGPRWSPGPTQPALSWYHHIGWGYCVGVGIVLLLASVFSRASYNLTCSLSLLAGAVLLLGAGIALGVARNRLHRATVVALQARIPGLIPAAARADINRARAVARRTMAEVRLIFEPTWHTLSEGHVEPRPVAKDPLIVLFKDDSDDIALLGRFDCTAAEEYLAREHAVTP